MWGEAWEDFLTCTADLFPQVITEHNRRMDYPLLNYFITAGKQSFLETRFHQFKFISPLKFFTKELFNLFFHMWMHSLDPNPFLTPTHSWSISKSPHNFHSLFLKNTHTHTPNTNSPHKYTCTHTHIHRHPPQSHPVTPTPRNPHTHTHTFWIQLGFYAVCIWHESTTAWEIYKRYQLLRNWFFLPNQPLSANSFSNKKWGLEIHPSSAPTLEYGLD